MDKPNWWKTTCAVFLLCATTPIALPAQTFTTLHSFDSTDGANPSAALVQATDGSLYGTTSSGGSGGGTVFKITPSGTLKTLYSFCSQSGCTDGEGPAAALAQATNGNFYGTTSGGGANGNNYGTVFKITPSGALTTLHSFNFTDGYLPYGGLAQAADGNFYGTTVGGGANGFGGTIFKITPSGTLITLYSFCSQSGCADGLSSFAGLVQTTDGSFYGTTLEGGANGSGTVFKITPGGTLTTLYSFCSQSGCPDGRYPHAALAQDTNGNLYGTTEDGGANGSDAGTIFRVTPGGTLTTLYSFCSQSGCTDGAYPRDALIQATDGNFYGTTAADGTNGLGGTVFKVTPSGTLITLYSFCSQSNCTDGQAPLAALAQDTNGKFYGTTSAGGGASNTGTVFSLSVGLGPFVETQTTSGKVGATVNILGTNLTGATSVSFNGTAATFTVVSRSLITTTVPAGATTGIVQVVTPSGTLSSNAPFRVLP